MISIISGQNDRWAQFAALQTPTVTPPTQNGGLGFSNAGTVAADTTAVSPVSASTSSPLSNNMSFMLMMFGRGLDSASGTGASGTDASGATGSATPTANEADSASGTQGGRGFGSLLADLRSLMASLTTNTQAAGAAGSSTGAASSGATTSDVSDPLSGVGTNGTLASSLLQDLNAITLDLGTLAAAFGGTNSPSNVTQSRSPDAAQSPPPPAAAAVSADQPNGNQSGGNQSGGGADVTNVSPAGAGQTWADGPVGRGGGLQQSLAAYTVGDQSVSSPALQNISV